MIVNYNTPEIITSAVNSIRNHVDKVIIIDNSDPDNPAFDECDRLESDNVRVMHTLSNIGHGPGLALGIKHLDTDLIICMDSDAELIDPGVIQEMRNALTYGVYGSGPVLTTDINGHNSEKGIDYLHPYFCMFRRNIYNMHEGFINHGAPFIRTMNQINGRLKVVNIPDITEKCYHHHRRTREIAGTDWLKNWEATT